MDAVVIVDVIVGVIAVVDTDDTVSVTGGTEMVVTSCTSGMETCTGDCTGEGAAGGVLSGLIAGPG